VIDLFDECGLDSTTGAAIAAAHLGALSVGWVKSPSTGLALRPP